MKRNQPPRGPDRRRSVYRAITVALLATLLLHPLFARSALAQDGINTGAIHVNGGTTLYAAGQLTNDSSSTFTNDGGIVVNGSINFQRGAIDEPNSGLVTFLDGATAINASAAGHIDGPVRKVGDDAFTFPIGDQGHLGLLGISAPLAPTAVITAAHIYENPRVALGADLSGALTDLSTVAYWTVDGSASVNLTLHWDGDSAIAALSGGDLANLRVAGWDGTTWQDLGNDGTTGTATAGTIAANGLTPNAYQAYAIGTIATDAPVISVSPTNPDFGLVDLNSTGYQTVTISNVGTQPLTVNTLTLGGSSLITRSGGTCAATPFDVAVGASCTVRLSFAPTGVGFAGATLTIDSNGGDPVLVNISAGSVNPLTPLLLNRVVLSADEIDSDAIDNGDAHCLPIGGGTVLNNKVAVAADEADSDLRDNSSAACIAMAVPDLTTALGQPVPNLVVDVASNVPVTVTNIGGAPATGPVTTTVSLPVSVTTPANFVGGNSWNCTTSGQTVTCVNSGPINAGGNSTFTVPVTPEAGTVGTQPGPFNATTMQVGGETVTNNNAATPMTPTIAVAAGNSAPAITQPLTSPVTITVLENTVAITDVNTTDDGGVEGNGTLTYTLSGPDAASFTIDAYGVISFTNAPDFENPGSMAGTNTYSVTVTVRDAGGATDSVAMVITVSDVNDTPDLTTALGQPVPNLVVDVASNVPVTVTNIGGAATTGPVTTTVSLPVSVTAPANFDGGNGWSCITSGQTIICVNSGPINAGGNRTFDVPVTPDGSTVGTAPGPFSATTSQTADEVNAANNGPATMTPTTPVAAGGAAPSITSGSNVSIPENTTVVTTVTASGTAPITYSIVGGADAALFTIDESTGELRFSAAPDFENATDANTDGIYEVVVRASNSVGTDDQPMSITVSDVNDTPDLTTALGQPVPNLVAGVASNVPVTVTNIGGAPATGPITTTVTMPVSVTAPANFDGGNGWSCTTSGQTVTCVSAGPINAGGNSTFNVPVTPGAGTVGTTPGPFNATTMPVGGETITNNNAATPMTPTIAVAAGNSAPAITQPLTSPVTITVLENTVAITDVNTTDDSGVEGNGTLTYTLSGPDAASFTIDAYGVISFTNAPDFEHPGSVAGTNTYSVTVTVRDAGSATDSITITVTVTDVSEGPDGATVAIKMILGGAYDSSTRLMRTQLHTLPDFPLTSPYGGGEMITSRDVLTANNIVDWVLVELRSSTELTNVVAARAGLLQADGDVVDVDGVSTLQISDTVAGTYYVAVHHRNHLSVMTATPVALMSSGATVDFTNSTMSFYGSYAQRFVQNDGVYVLWTGDTDGSGFITGAGGNNDITVIMRVVLGAAGNTERNRNYTVTAYDAADVNLDGQVLLAGDSSDTSMLLEELLRHPGNRNHAANFKGEAQLP